MKELPTSDYVERFIGGRGIANGLCGDRVPPEIGAMDLGNALIFATSPVLGGTLLPSSDQYGTLPGEHALPFLVVHRLYKPGDATVRLGA
jgi:hypothetical protein